MFTTTKLAGTILEAPGFPPEQKPSLTTRDADGWQHIILAPLPREGFSTPVPNAEDDDDDDKPVPQFLHLTFHFKANQDEMQLKKLADHLKKFMKLENTTLHKVEWGGIWGTPGHRFREAVHKVLAHVHSPVSRLKPPIMPSTSLQNERLCSDSLCFSNDQVNRKRKKTL